METDETAKRLADAYQDLHERPDHGQSSLYYLMTMKCIANLDGRVMPEHISPLIAYLEEVKTGYKASSTTAIEGSDSAQNLISRLRSIL